MPIVDKVLILCGYPSDAMYYRCDQLEVIRLRQCRVAYPEHSHVSIYTVGIVLAGEVLLQYRRRSQSVTPGGIFWVAPYEAHAITPVSAYDMLSLCVPADRLQQSNTGAVSGLLMRVLRAVDADCPVLSGLMPSVGKTFAEISGMRRSGQCLNSRQGCEIRVVSFVDVMQD